MDAHWLIDAAPDDVRRRLTKDGDTVALAVTRASDTFIVHEIDPAQAWFWSSEWQEGERAADVQAAAGQGTIYHSDEEFLAALAADLEPLA